MFRFVMLVQHILGGFSSCFASFDVEYFDFYGPMLYGGVNSSVTCPSYVFGGYFILSSFNGFFFKWFLCRRFQVNKIVLSFINYSKKKLTNHIHQYILCMLKKHTLSVYVVIFFIQKGVRECDTSYQHTGIGVPNSNGFGLLGICIG